MIDANKIIEALRNDPEGTLRRAGGQAVDAGEAMIERLKTDPAARNLAMAGAGGALAGILFSKGAPRMSSAIAKMGGLAAIGGLAYMAWKRHEAKQAGQQPGQVESIEQPPPTMLAPPDSAQGQKAARLVLRAMINAAKADGHIDSEEKARLFDRLGQVPLNAEEQNFLFSALAQPMETDSIVKEADNAALAAQVYAASLLAIDPDQPAEKTYLEELARRLNLPPAYAAEVRAAA
jgi:uncharacterized membrane protein YebE (DUF533 family)